LWKLIDRNARLEIMGTGFGFTEGPVWDSTGFLVVSDESKNAIYHLYPDGHREQLIALGDPDGNTYDSQHRLIDCASLLRAIIRLSPDGKTYDILADHYEGKKLNSPNDVTNGPDGALYFTDPTLDLVRGQKQEIPFQGVYRLDANGEVTLLTKDLEQPNGLAFSPDGRYLYIDDSAQKNIRRYRFHSNGTLSDGIIFGDEKVEGASGVPDGMKVDTGEPVRHRPTRHLGLELGRQAHGHHCLTGATRKPDMGRAGLLHTLPHSQLFCLYSAD
jgi:gluconolactonase